MAVRPLTVRVLGPAVVCIIVSMVTLAPGISGKGLLIASAQAQSKQQSPLEKARTAVETLINRLRGRDMPEGIVKSNGRIEATQVDVAAKYAGRRATRSRLDRSLPPSRRPKPKPSCAKRRRRC
jgi:HlyD family secretion protein